MQKKTLHNSILRKSQTKVRCKEHHVFFCSEKFHTVELFLRIPLDNCLIMPKRINDYFIS